MVKGNKNRTGMLLAAVFSLVFFMAVQSVNAQTPVSWTTKITDVYTNNAGVILIRISSPHSSPDGYLRLEGTLDNAFVRAMFATICQAHATRRYCLVRAITKTGYYWPIDIVQMLDSE